MVQITEKISKLPLAGKKIVAGIYTGMKDKGFTDYESRQVAIKAADDYINGKSESYAMQPVQLETAIVKDGFFSPEYYFDAILSSTEMDAHGHRVSKNLLKYLDEANLVEYDGDIFHNAYRTGDGSWKGLFKMIKKSFDGKALNIRFSINKAHDKFKEFLKLNKETPFTGLSAEFYSPKMIGDKIVFSNGLGWTLTPEGSNPDSKINGRIKK